MAFKIKHFLVLIFLLFQMVIITFSQNEIGVSIRNSTYIGTGFNMPFWFTANKSGTIENGHSLLNLSEIVINKKNSFPEKKINYKYGIYGIAGLSKSSYLQFNQAFLGADYNRWQIEAGLFQDEIVHGGLSTSNGNMSRSINARPYPKIRLSSKGYLGFPFIKKWFQFKAEYDEGWLNDKRYVSNTMLHHKSLYGQITPVKGLKLSLGLEHFVMWGGTSPNPNYGKLPNDFLSYILCISASPGNNSFPEFDQINVAGNQLGTYQFSTSYESDNWNAVFYVSHPFEDYSGIALRNYPDNLIGFYVESKNKHKIVSSFCYEIMNTKHQSVNGSYFVWDEINNKLTHKESDNYYNHGIYASGYTYHKMIMGSPLFRPKYDGENAMYFESNRFLMHHIGTKGIINNNIYWKTMATFSQHYGTFWEPYSQKNEEFSLYLELTFSNNKLPFTLNSGIASDISRYNNTNLGFQFSISKQF